MEDRFENMVDAIQKFYIFDKLENYKDDPYYELFCNLLSNLYFEMTAIDTIDEVDKDE